MIDRSPCINQDALVAYAYEECEPSEREAIAAHVAGCVACTEELQALRDTRAHLGAWVVPATPLGFQITRTEAEAPAAVPGSAERFGRSPGRAGGWWRQPLPAWAQAAAALVIFASGAMFGSGRDAGPLPQVAEEPAAAVAIRPVVDSAPSPRDLARFEGRLRALEVALTRAVPAQTGQAEAANTVLRTTTSLDEATRARIRLIVDERLAESERRQREESVRMLAGVVRYVDAFGATAERVGALEERIDETEQAVRMMAAGSSLVRRTSFATGP